MKIKSFIVLLFIVLSILGFCLWYQFIYPQLTFSNLKVDRVSAVKISDQFLQSLSVNPKEFQQASIFVFDGATNQFLQSTIGFEGLKKFIRNHQFDMYCWVIRYFKENQKEEYRVTVSSQTGEIISFKHTIDEIAMREVISQQAAQIKAYQFLHKKYQFNDQDYQLADQFTRSFDHRTEYTFAWQKKSVQITWKTGDKSANGKLYISATISGDEVLSFTKNYFFVPDEFNRRIAEEENSGKILSKIIHFFYTILIVGSVYFVVSRRNDLVMHTVKKFYIAVAIVFFILALISELNDFQYIFFNYRNTAPFTIYFWESFSERIMDIFFAAIVIVLPSLSGELLHYQVNKDKKFGSFLHNIRSSFFSRSNSWLILIGYPVFFIMLGLQSFLIKFGQDNWGVWVEHNWMAKFSTSYWPFLIALTVAFRSSLTEEIMYRLFAVNWVKKIFKNDLISILFPSLIWGFAHTNYPVFPMWFRGIEMTIIGIFLSIIYLRFGLISCIVGHYLFNVFWNSADYLFGQSNPFYFYSSVLIILLPMFLAFLAFVINKREEEKEMVWRLNKHQLHNIEILMTYLKVNESRLSLLNQDALKKEIASHGWDMAVVEAAIKKMGWQKLSA